MAQSKRQIAREKAIIGIYQHLLVDNNINDIKSFLKSDELLERDEQSYQFSEWIVETTLSNMNSYIELINKYLKKGWSFDRLGVMEKSILLVATCEILESDLPKNIIVNEAIVNAKQFCDVDSFKFINGVLGQI